MLMSSCSVLVMVADLDIVRVAIEKSKTHAPLIVHGDGMLPAAFGLEPVQAIAGRYLQIVQARSEVDVLQLARCPSRDMRRKAPGRPAQEQFLGPPIRERPAP